MNQIEERLAEEVRKHEHLYNPYRTDKDPQTAYNSWKMISASVGLEVLRCSTLWRQMRDRFVRQNKALRGSGDRKATAFYKFLSWLEPHIRHRETSSKYDKVNLKFLVFEQPLCVRAGTLAVQSEWESPLQMDMVGVCFNILKTG